MKIALSSDEYHQCHDYIVEWLEGKGHVLELFGSFKSKQEEQWVSVIADAAKSVASGNCQEGIFFCWSGTGACIVSNKFRNIRAALCTDEETARLARVWNHANILILPNRLLNQQIANNILTAWFEPADTLKGSAGVEALRKLERSIE